MFTLYLNIENFILLYGLLTEIRFFVNHFHISKISLHFSGICVKSSPFSQISHIFKI